MDDHAWDPDVSVTLVLTSVLALLASRLAALDGKVSEVAGALATQNPQLSLQGIVIAGMVIGALGVLADTGVTQASAVMRCATPTRCCRRASCIAVP